MKTILTCSAIVAFIWCLWIVSGWIASQIRAIANQLDEDDEG
jgi:hypothetical protein